VASDTGALPEVVGRDGESGLLVAPGDAPVLSRAIARLLDDVNLRTRLGVAGRARALERFSWRATAEATVDVYRQAISDRAHGAEASTVEVPC